MYLWNTSALASELKTGKLSQRERFKYLFTYVLMATLTYDLLNYSDKAPFNHINAVLSSLAYIITISGLILTYKANENGDNKDYIDRYICISLPVTIRLMVLLFGIIFIYVICCDLIGYCFIDDNSEDATWFDVFLSLILQSFYWWRIYHHIKWISNSETIE